ncbi:hypothetical protein HBI83_073390 [Parastagonospora nodorum]|nr:hypothetical protein HBI83_073390 [Parastagonospora nodorum]
MRLKKNVLGGPYRKIKLKRYTSSNKGTPAPSRTIILLSQLLTNNRTTLSPLPVCSSIATTPCKKVTAAYALNYLKLQNKFQFLSANMIALIGIVLYNTIKEYYNDRIRKIIHFHSYTIENDYYDNDVNNILIKYTDNKRQRYNTLIEDYNRARKREDNILTIDKCRTMRLRELLREIHDILLREFRRANDFTESVTHNDNEQV